MPWRLTRADAAQTVAPQGLPECSAQSTSGIGEKPFANLRLRKPASRMSGDPFQSSTQKVRFDNAVLEHLVEQPQHSVASDLLFVCKRAQLSVSG